MRTQSIHCIRSHRKAASHCQLWATQFQFRYSFCADGYICGWVAGDRLSNQPHLIFNLRNLQATYVSPEGRRQPFDTVYGQFNLDFPGALFTGSNAATGAFFSFTYRGQEATIYDAAKGMWLSEIWEPEQWQVREVPAAQSVAVPLSPRLIKQSA